MSEYRTIKDLVVETCVSEGTFPSYEKLTALVRDHFPSSKWQKTHYSWYKSRIKNGEIAVPGIAPSAPSSSDAEPSEETVEEALEASVSLERDLHLYLASRVHELEPGLSVVADGIEHQTEAGRIDILARDAGGALVVIELKAGNARDAALGQLLGYMGCLAKPESKMRGLLVASDFEQRVVYAAKGLPNIRLIKYQLAFAFDEVL